ncbi:MarR family transcriptional regulator [Shewanella sp.]|nr:MarR family transcriptional regulator [Shewanella sp.]
MLYYLIMMNDIEIWLERLTALYRSQMRHCANSEGMQVVHLEILQYLSIANKYSNTAQAVSEYLGQTKGSISQSLKLLENNGYIERQASAKDKRVVGIYLTQTGKDSLTRMSSQLLPNLKGSNNDVDTIKALLKKWQVTNHHKGFGQCQSCKFNLEPSRENFLCALTNETLSLKDIKKICREHEF